VLRFSLWKKSGFVNSLVSPLLGEFVNSFFYCLTIYISETFYVLRGYEPLLWRLVVVGSYSIIFAGLPPENRVWWRNWGTVESD
jgi:hypothetical protein